MSTFSERYGYVVKPLQLESMTIELRNRIWNIYRCEICNDIAVIDSHYLEEIMDACGLSYTSVYDNADLDKNLAVFRKWYDQAEWYRIYDFVEIYLAFLPTKLFGTSEIRESASRIYSPELSMIARKFLRR